MGENLCFPPSRLFVRFEHELDIGKRDVKPVTSKRDGLRAERGAKGDSKVSREALSGDNSIVGARVQKSLKLFAPILPNDPYGNFGSQAEVELAIIG